jgi:anhydro-N-acetylmuramic acid kinase
MSGTSLDGIDLCEAEFKFENKHWTFDIIKSETIAYPKPWVNTLKSIHLLSKQEIYQIDEKYTKYLAEIISGFMTNPENIDLVCSHGHTAFHQPEKNFTYQIGNLPELAQQIQKTVVCDFRTADVVLGGQGAPLVPIGDRLLFPDYGYCINIGGFVNVSFEDKGFRKAFDICPANKVLNYYAEKLGLNYDDKGKIASQGKCSNDLLSELNSIKFYKQNPPKSLGVEWLEKEMLPLLENYNLAHKDKLNTLCHHIAFQISKVLKNKNSKVLITGGGAYHEYLIECIKSYSTIGELHIPEAKIVDFKEALIFGFLGILKIRNEVNVLKSVTGAQKDHCSGVVFLGNKSFIK